MGKVQKSVRTGCGVVLLLVACVPAFWVVGCVRSEAANARMAASVSVGMTPVEVEALLGPPIFESTLGMHEPRQHVFTYRGFGAGDRIEVTFDGASKVNRYSKPPWWIHT